MRHTARPASDGWPLLAKPRYRWIEGHEDEFGSLSPNAEHTIASEVLDIKRVARSPRALLVEKRPDYVRRIGIPGRRAEDPSGAVVGLRKDMAGAVDGDQFHLRR